ncbi:MAG TPA: hydroxymethylbilane synthase [Hyphomonadaceae bacterium]|jgi:hydroxymethylbilane synthase|nr:hydroxymethylbilane synthase [Hyphomonadaceae bacterium]
MAQANTLRIGTRGSPLALAQANLFAGLVAKASGGAITTTIHPFTTTGDKILDKPLQDAGGKGLFTKELDRAQEVGEIDVAVHSLKDVTVKLEPHLTLAAYLEREDPRDCIIGPWAKIADLPQGTVVGTSSLRRRSQLLAIRPDLKPVTFRGNVQTRLRKLAEGEAQATILAAAGLRRLGMIDKAAGIIPPEDMLPAGGQGIIGVTIRKDAPEWLRDLCSKIDVPASRLAAVAERSFLRRLDGSCRTPIAAHFRLTGSGAEMAGEVLSDEGDKRWRAEGKLDRAPTEADAEAFGLRLAEDVAAQRSRDGIA